MTLKIEDQFGTRKYVTNCGCLVGECLYWFAQHRWVFLLDQDIDSNPMRWMNHTNTQKYKAACAPHVVKFIDDQLALLNVAERLKS